MAVYLLNSIVYFLDSLTIDMSDALYLDGEHFPLILVPELGGEGIRLCFILGDFNPVAGVDHTRDGAIIVDGSATEVVRSLVGDDVGENQPLAPRQTRIFGGDGTIGTSFLDCGDIVVVYAHSASEGGILEDFGLALADLERTDGTEGSELSLEAHELVDAQRKVNRGEGRSVEGGGGECGCHALYSNGREKRSIGDFSDPSITRYLVNVCHTPLKGGRSLI